MGINNIDDLKGNPSVKADEPTVPPNAENTQAGKPATPIDNVASQQQGDGVDGSQDSSDSATGDSNG